MHTSAAASTPEPTIHATTYTHQEGTERLLARLIDELDFGVMVLDPTGRMLAANEAARSLLRRQSPFALAADHLQPVDPIDRRRWRAMLDACLRSERRLGSFGTGDHAVSVALSPVATDGHRAPEIGILASFGRLRMCEPTSLAAFAKSRGLTTAEAKVLDALVAGRTPTAIARNHAVAISTVRAQIRQILEKTDCGGIRELIVTIARLAPMRASVTSATDNAAAED
jgi:DNA-binding CsgD family transcriptional regulator